MRWVRRHADLLSLVLTAYASAVTVVLAAGVNWQWSLLLPLPLVLGVPPALGLLRRVFGQTERDSMTDDLLAVSVAPNRYPLCDCPQGTFACGRSAAGLGTRHLHAAIGHLLILISDFESEVDRETFFGESQIVTHLAMAIRVHAVLAARLRGDLAVRCSTRMSDVAAIYNELAGIQEEIGEKIVGPLHDLLLATRDEGDRKEQIRHVIKDEVKAELAGLRGPARLPRLKASALEVASRMTRDWDNAAIGLRMEAGCSPVRDVECPKAPAEIQEFLGHIA